MADYYGANVTKYRAGGTGDNIIADGYIKTVEKVWMDSYTLTATVPSLATIAIATIPKNKKITDVIVTFPATISPTTVTINVGTADDVDKFIKAAHAVRTTGVAGAIDEVGDVRMNNTDGFQYVTTAVTDIVLSFGVTALLAPTDGTTRIIIKTVVKYT